MTGVMQKLAREAHSMLHKLLQQPLRLPPSRIPLAVEQLLQDDPFSCIVYNSSHLLPEMPIA